MEHVHDCPGNVLENVRGHLMTGMNRKYELHLRHIKINMSSLFQTMLLRITIQIVLILNRSPHMIKYFIYICKDANITGDEVCGASLGRKRYKRRGFMDV